MSQKRLIIGLGNPGESYRRTRHNFGFLVVDEIARRQRLQFESKAWCQAQMAEGDVDGVGFVLVKPSTFMNNSGVAVKKIVGRRAVDPGGMLVVCDDLNLELGQMRVRAQGSDGGHHGLVSIMEQLATREFPRLRLGIGKPVVVDETVDYVLGRFSSDEQKEVDLVVARAADCCLAWVTGDMSQVMSQFNKRNENE